MSVTAPPSDPRPPGRPRRWRQCAEPVPACGRDHAPGGGRLDESARRLSHQELAVAAQLVAEGHLVSSKPELVGRGRTADLEVCGLDVEVKSWLPVAQRDGRAPGKKSVVNKLVSAQGQGTTVVLSAWGSGLTAAAAWLGMGEYGTRSDADLLRRVRVMGDGFDLSWKRDIGIGRSAAPDRAPGIPNRSRGTPDRGSAAPERARAPRPEPVRSRGDRSPASSARGRTPASDLGLGL
ncbi:MAG: hypothetical protein ACRDYY_00230 [Acidimicrobiales bacterium]